MNTDERKDAAPGRLRLDKRAELYLDAALGDRLELVRPALESIGYFEAPASAGHHLAARGGLLRHSVNVTERLLALTDAMNIYWPRRESPYIVGMFHDLVKCRCYRAVPCAAQDAPPRWERVQPEFPGHGVCSVAVAASLGIELKAPEVAAITYHMGHWGVGKEYDEDTFNAAMDIFAPCIIAAHCADWFAAKVDEGPAAEAEVEG